MTNFVIVDLSNLFHRVRHGSKDDPFTKASLGLHILFRSLRKLYRDLNADHIVFAVDGGSWRYEIYPAYKAKRKLDRSELTIEQKEENEIFFATLNDLTSYLSEKTNCTVLQAKGMEGDDFIGRWIQNHPDDQHVIVSSDSDFIQLLDSNVKIFDGMTQRLISTDSVINEKGEKLEFSVGTSDGKIKIKQPNEDFIPEEEWWKKALFLKIIRGDAGDGIFSAFPGVRYKGSPSKNGQPKPRISEAWEDRHEKGFFWNNFMLQEWDKLVGSDENGNPIMDKVRVIDEFRLNESLIDLTKQPKNIQDKMDSVIVEAVQKPKYEKVSLAFLKFCEKHRLVNIVAEANDHVSYLKEGYR